MLSKTASISECNGDRSLEFVPFEDGFSFFKTYSPAYSENRPQVFCVE